jgi:hypothetical protein
MAAHTKNIEERNSNYQTIVSGLPFSGIFFFLFFSRRTQQQLNHRQRPPRQKFSTKKVSALVHFQSKVTVENTIENLCLLPFSGPPTISKVPSLYWLSIVHILVSKVPSTRWLYAANILGHWLLRICLKLPTRWSITLLGETQTHTRARTRALTFEDLSQAPNTLIVTPLVCTQPYLDLTKGVHRLPPVVMCWIKMRWFSRSLLPL